VSRNAPSKLIDGYGREIRTIRISVTDRCNLRCTYCRGVAEFESIPHDDVLRYEEMIRIAEAAAELGVVRFRVTGGEPLVRKEVDSFIGMLRALDGVRDVALTTNGTLLARSAERLARAGLSRVTVSIDSLDPERYRRITGGELGPVLEGINAARAAGLAPVKVNVVVMRGINDDEIEAFVDFAAREALEVRFIEHMPTLQTDEGHRRLFVSGDEIKKRLAAQNTWREAPGRRGAPARRWTRVDGAVTVGFITPISDPFCTNCERLRLTADGRLKMCLWSQDDVDMRSLLRGGATKQTLQDALREAVAKKPAGCREFHAFAMNRVGG